MTKLIATIAMTTITTIIDDVDDDDEDDSDEGVVKSKLTTEIMMMTMAPTMMMTKAKR